MRITGHQLSNALTVSKGLAREGAENTLSRVRSATMQHQVAQRLNDVPASFVNRLTPDEQSRLGSFLARNGDDGAELIADGGGEALEVFKNPSFDAATTDKLVKLYTNRGSSAPPYRHIDPDITPGELIRIVENNGNIHETIGVMKTPQGVKWLENGNSGAGYRHILEGKKNAFFSSDRLGISTSGEIKDLIYETVKNGDAYKIPDADGGGFAYVYSKNGKKVSVITGENGYVVTAIPDVPNNIDI